MVEGFAKLPSWDVELATVRETGVFELRDSVAGGDVEPSRPLLSVLQGALQSAEDPENFGGALEMIAEHSLAALEAAALSISRWDRDRGVLRTIINVGDLGSGGQRWPLDEEYSLAELRFDSYFITRGRSDKSLADGGCSVSRALLSRLEKESQLAVPVMRDGVMWGELWASCTGSRRFGLDDLRLLEAIAALTAAALARTDPGPAD